MAVSRARGSASRPGSDHEKWNRSVRGETRIQQAVRNFAELLQEVRVAQTGIQVLFAFLLGLGFTGRFDELGAGQQAVYVIALVLSAVAAGVLLAPVMYHRLVFRRRLKLRVVAVAHRLAVLGLTLVLLAMVCAVQLAASLVLHGWATLLAAALGLGVGLLWLGWPAWARLRPADDSW